jgi:hypothetical protein
MWDPLVISSSPSFFLLRSRAGETEPGRRAHARRNRGETKSRPSSRSPRRVASSWIRQGWSFSLLGLLRAPLGLRDSAARMATELAAESARWPNPRLCRAFPLTIKPAEHLGPPLHPPVSRHSIPPSPCGRQELFPHQLRVVAAGSHRGRGIDLKDPFRGKGRPRGEARWHLRALGSPVAVLIAHRGVNFRRGAWSRLSAS